MNKNMYLICSNKSLFKGLPLKTKGVSNINEDILGKNNMLIFPTSDLFPIRKRLDKIGKKVKGDIVEYEDGHDRLNEGIEILRDSFRPLTKIHNSRELKRFALARDCNAQDELILRASVFDDILSVMDCDFNSYFIEIKKCKFFKNFKDIETFEVDEDGSYIYWPKEDVHLNLDGIRGLIDEKYREKKEDEAYAYYKQLSEVMINFRKECKITQKDIASCSGYDVRTVRRFENNDKENNKREKGNPTKKLIEGYAKAHKMKLNNYLNEISKRYREK